MPQKGFCNSIGPKRTPQRDRSTSALRTKLGMSVPDQRRRPISSAPKKELAELDRTLLLGGLGALTCGINAARIF